MKIYAIYDRDNKFIVAFPSRKEAEDYGKTTFGNESGWSYAIVEKYLHDYPKFIDTKPSTPLVQPYTIPYTPPIQMNPPKKYLQHTILSSQTYARY